MRVFIAILKDSYREAASSMVLWIALVGIALLLILLAPLGIVSGSNTKLRFQELTDPEKFVTAIFNGRDNTNSPAGHMWSLLKDDQQQLFQRIADAHEKQHGQGPDTDSARVIVVMTINPLFKKRQFYKAEAFESVNLDDELRNPDPPTAATADYTHRNLMRFERAFSKYVSIKQQSAMSLQYLGFEIWELPILPKDKSTYVELGIRTVLYWFMGFVGVFASLLFTGALIPRMFEPGEISLLLSKPVHRCSVFLAKFFGGCTFTLICATFLVTGIWFLLGTRFGEWRHGLLWSIPLYVFLFSIYFSMSALAGAIWRNAIVSLAAVIVFWIGLSALWAANLWLKATQVQAKQFVNISADAEHIFAVDGSRNIHSWDSQRGDWMPVSDDTAKRNNGGSWFRQQTFLTAGADGKNVLVFRQLIDSNGNPSTAMFLTGKADQEWELQASSTPPDVAFALAARKNGDAIFVGKRGIYRHVGQSEQERKFHEFTMGLFRTSSKAFEKITTNDFRPISANAAVAFNPEDESFVAFSEDQIWHISRSSDGKYVSDEPRLLSIEYEKRPATIDIGGNLVVLGLGKKLVVLDATELTVILETDIPRDEVIQRARVAPDGSSAAVLTKEGTILVLDGKSHAFLPWTPAENGKATTIGYDEKSRLVVVDDHRSATIYDVAMRSPAHRLNGSVGFFRYVYDYAVAPVHTILPKPEEVDNAIKWLVSNDDAEDGDIPADESLNDASDDGGFNAQNAILSNLAFIAVMLGLGCLYIARSDF